MDMVVVQSGSVLCSLISWAGPASSNCRSELGTAHQGTCSEHMGMWVSASSKNKETRSSRPSKSINPSALSIVTAASCSPSSPGSPKTAMLET